VAVMMVAMTPTAPTHFRGHLLAILNGGSGSTGTRQRQRLGAFSRSSNDEQCADRGKAQNFRYVHIYPPLDLQVSRRRRFGLNQTASPRRRSRNWIERRECEMNACATDMNANRANRFPLHVAIFLVMFISQDIF
jgi:hypothetical protein